MSLHRSLKGGSTMQKKRNVLKRYERIDLLKKRKQLSEEDSSWGLPKTKPEA